MGTRATSSPIFLGESGVNNYAMWRAYMTNYLLSEDLWDVVEEVTPPPSIDEDEVAFKAWRKKNAKALNAIQNSCTPHVLSMIWENPSAKSTWDALTRTFNSPQQGTVEIEDYLSYWNLYVAIGRGDWTAIRDFLELQPESLSARITPLGATALHISAEDGYFHIVRGLTDLMSEQDLGIQDKKGNTALHYATVGGTIDIARCMITKNPSLVSFVSYYGWIPITQAAHSGNTDMVRYLYSVTPLELLTPQFGNHGSSLLSYCIVANILDVALDLLKRCPSVAFMPAMDGTTSILRMAQLPSLFPSGTHLKFWKRWLYNTWHKLLPLRQNFPAILAIPRMKQLYDREMIHAQSLEILNCMCDFIPTLTDRQVGESQVYVAVSQAVKNGIIEFIVAAIKAAPFLLWTIDNNGRYIFMLAIEYRQENIFNLFYGLDDAKKKAMVAKKDNFGNNMLHLAGMSAPATIKLDRISGAALQLKWYKEVEGVVNPICKQEQNADGLIPYELFTKTNEEIRKRGEEWMKGTATSCTVVGALVITIMFTAGFTVPGGNNQDTGFPIFLHKRLFAVFQISDVLSLSSSSTSVLMFLGILTSRYAETDFLISLPAKMIIGLSTLFFSIASMMVAFCAGLAIMLSGQLQFIIPTVLLASAPVTIFMYLQVPLLKEMLKSTNKLGIFNKKMKRWM